MKDHEQGERGESDHAGLSRRRFAKAGLLGVPLIMTLHSRPVLGAYQCTVSGMMSGNLSNFDPNVSECLSLTEATWATIVDQWPLPYTGDTPFHDMDLDLFGTGLFNYGAASFSDVINNDFGDNNVGFAAIGALLNAARYGEAFGYDEQWVIHTWNNWPAGATSDLAEFFSALNNRWADTTTP